MVALPPTHAPPATHSPAGCSQAYCDSPQLLVLEAVHAYVVPATCHQVVLFKAGEADALDVEVGSLFKD